MNYILISAACVTALDCRYLHVNVSVGAFIYVCTYVDQETSVCQ